MVHERFLNGVYFRQASLTVVHFTWQFNFTILVSCIALFFCAFQNCEKPLSVCLSALTNSAPNGWIFMKFEI